MDNIFRYIKHNLKFIWQIAMFVNNLIFRIFYFKKFRTKLFVKNLIEIKNGFNYRSLDSKDAFGLSRLLKNNSIEKRLEHFKPHNFDFITIQKVLRKPNQFSYGLFNDNKELIGYYLINFYITKRAFVGLMIDKNYKGYGLSRLMMKELFKLVKETYFNVYATVYQSNVSSLKTMKSFSQYKVVDKKKSGFYLIKFDI